MTYDDTLEEIRVDLADLRDLGARFDDNSLLTMLARLHAAMVEEYGGKPLPAEMLRHLDDCN